MIQSEFRLFLALGVLVVLLLMWTHAYDWQNTLSSDLAHAPANRIVVLVLNSEMHEDDRLNRLKAITMTWGPAFPHLFFVDAPFDEMGDRVWTPPSTARATSRHQLTWALSETLRQFGRHFDWILVVDDSTFVLDGNLRRMLGQLPAHEGLYLGHRLASTSPAMGSKEHRLVFNSRGAFVLSRGAVDVLGSLIRGGDECVQSHGGSADLMVAQCLRNAGIVPSDTRDHNERDRFHVFQPATLMGVEGGHFDFPVPWYETYSFQGVRLGFDGISPQSVSFHYTSAGEMLALDFMLNFLNARGHVTAEEFRAHKDIWPNHLRRHYDKYVQASAGPVQDLLLDWIAVDQNFGIGVATKKVQRDPLIKIE